METCHSGISYDLIYSAKMPYFARTAVICACTDLEYLIMSVNIEGKGDNDCSPSFSVLISLISTCSNSNNPASQLLVHIIVVVQ